MLTVLTVGRIIASRISGVDAYSLLDAAEEIVNAQDVAVTRSAYSPDILVAVASGLAEVVEYLGSGQKIQAIKALRTYTSCGLKEAKDACDALVDPWGAKPQAVRSITSAYAPF